jgi:hypothetical protein
LVKNHVKCIPKKNKRKKCWKKTKKSDKKNKTFWGK